MIASRFVVFEPAFDLPGTFLTDYRVILNSCRLVQFVVLTDVPEMQADVVRRGSKQIGHLGLGHSQRLPLQPHFDVSGVVFEDDDLTHAATSTLP